MNGNSMAEWQHRGAGIFTEYYISENNITEPIRNDMAIPHNITVTLWQHK